MGGFGGEGVEAGGLSIEVFHNGDLFRERGNSHRDLSVVGRVQIALSYRHKCV